MRIYLLFILFSISLNQNIITSWNYDKVAMYDIQKINTFLLSEFKNKVYDLPNNILWNNIRVENLKMINIETSLYDSFLNYNNGLFLFTPNKVTFYFNFSYSESTRGYEGNATLELKIQTLKIKVKKDNASQEAIISTKMVSPMDNYNIPGIQDKEFLRLLQDTLFSGFQLQSILSRTISDQITNGLLKYYNQFYSKKKEISIKTSNFFGNFKFPLNNNKFMYFCEDLLNEYKNNFCYYFGYFSKDEEVKDKAKIPLSNERFSHNEDNLFNIFINKDLINDISNYIVKYHFYFNPKIYNNKTNIKDLSYDFKVSSLKNYFNGLQNLKDSDYFYCEINIDKFTLNEVIYRTKFIIDNFNFVINITSRIEVGFPLTKNIRFNLCLKNAKTTNVEIISNSQDLKIEIKNLENLKNAINESFDYEYNKICFLEKEFSMRDYFTKIKSIYIRDEGIYLEGNHLYQ